MLSCLWLCNPIDCSPPGSFVHGILQARTQEWVVISFSRGSSRPRDWTRVSWIAGGFFTSWAIRRWDVPLKIGWGGGVPAGQSRYVSESDFDGAGWRVLRILNTANSLHRDRQADGLVCVWYATSVAGLGWVKAKKEEKESQRNNRWFWQSTALQNCGSSSKWMGSHLRVWMEKQWNYRRIIPAACSGYTLKVPGVEAETSVRRPRRHAGMRWQGFGRGKKMSGIWPEWLKEWKCYWQRWAGLEG